MAFWKKKQKEKTEKEKAPAPETSSEPKKRTRRSPVAMEVKLAAVEALAEGLSCQEVAELVGVTDTTIHDWRRQYEAAGVEGLRKRPSDMSVRRRCEAIEKRILERREAHPERGVRRIRDDLRREEGISVSAETVRGVVNDAGLGNPASRAKRKPQAPRRFERPVPNALWQIDIFTFELKRMYRVYLVGIIDDHSRYIVGHGLFRQQKAEAVLEVVKGAIGQWGAPREILSDNGRQFVAWQGKSRFQKVLKRQGIGHVRSAPHHPMTLGKIERFWKTLWTEFLEEAVFASFADATQRLEHWVHYYNHQRPHQGIDGACPADRFYGVAEDREEAVRQGCRENSLRLALGQEPQPPFYLLGQLGETDVRVTRKDQDVEVRIGDAIHEVIRMGSPYTIDGKDSGEQGDAEVEGDDRGGAVPGGGDGAVGEGRGGGAVSDLRDEPADAVPGDGQSLPGSGGGPGAEISGTEVEATLGAEGLGTPDGQSAPGEGAEAHDPALRGSEDDPGSGAEAREGGVSTRGDPQGEKSRATAPTKATDLSGCDSPWLQLLESEDGPWEW
jgi:transposase InsO family protein